MNRDRKVIKFNAKCRDFNRQYEMNNNCDLDNGVYNKFMQSSRASLHFTDSQKDDENIDILSSQDSIELSFNKEKETEDLDGQELNEKIEEEIKVQQDRKNRGEFSDFEMITQEAESKDLKDNYIDNTVDKEDIDEFLVEEIAEYGYPKEFIFNSIEKNEINYATASYYILKKQLLIDSSHPLLAMKK